MTSESKPKAGSSRRLFLTFAIGDASYAVPFLRIAEVRTLQTAVPALAPPDYATGFVILHGRNVPVVDLRVSFGAPAGFDGETRLLVVWHRADARVGLLVDRVEDVLTIGADAISPRPDYGPGVDTRFISGTTEGASCRRLLLDLDQLF